MQTYIIKTINKEFYCGKTNNITKRMLEHKNQKHPHWFNSNNRRNFKVIYIFNDDYEKYIKQCGVKRICYLLDSICPSTLKG